MGNSKGRPLEGITIEDVQRMIDVCTGKYALRDKAIYQCLASSGARANEFLQLNVDDVNTADGTVLIKHGKSDKSRYTFSCTAERSEQGVRVGVCFYGIVRDNDLLIAYSIWREYEKMPILR